MTIANAFSLLSIKCHTDCTLIIRYLFSLYLFESTLTFLSFLNMMVNWPIIDCSATQIKHCIFFLFIEDFSDSREVHYTMELLTKYLETLCHLFISTPLFSWIRSLTSPKNSINHAIDIHQLYMMPCNQRLWCCTNPFRNC